MHAQSENDYHIRTTDAAGILRAALRLRRKVHSRSFSNVLTCEGNVEVYPEIERLVQSGVEVVPIFSSTVLQVSTRFGEAGEWAAKIEQVTGNKAITSLPEAEPLGPSKRLDLLLIAPCTGNTLSRLANAATDSPVLMAAKATLRNDRPVVIAVSTNDGLGLNLHNIATLLNTKNIFFVPFGQDAPHVKMNSLVAHMSRIPETCEAALEKRQLQPMVIERWQEDRL